MAAAAAAAREPPALWKFGAFGEGGAKWVGVAALPDGMVVFAPCNASSILIVDPESKAWEELGAFEKEHEMGRLRDPRRRQRRLRPFQR